MSFVLSSMKARTQEGLQGIELERKSIVRESDHSLLDAVRKRVVYCS